MKTDKQRLDALLKWGRLDYFIMPRDRAAIDRRIDAEFKVKPLTEEEKRKHEELRRRINDPFGS